MKKYQIKQRLLSAMEELGAWALVGGFFLGIVSIVQLLFGSQ